MTIENVLEAIQNFRTQIDQWGVTAETLIAVAFLASVMFVLSLREVMTWFLRVHTLRDEVKGLRKDISELKTMIAARPLVIETEVPAAEEPAPVKKKEDEKPSKTFRLDH
jgi:hypothetical protein